MRARRTNLAVAVAASALLVAPSGCTSDSNTSRTIGTADAYLAIVTWELGEIGPPGTNASLPVIYITAEDGATIDAGAQAKVVKSTVDQAKVRFTDVRNDAIDSGVDDGPVRDGGVMLIVDKIDSKGTSNLHLPVTVYHSKVDAEQVTLTIVATEDGATVTAASPQPSG